MKALTLRLDDAEYEALRVAAFERRTTITALIREALCSPAVQVDGGPHECASCADCLHDGNKCCGCYDGACCQAPAWQVETDYDPEDEWTEYLTALGPVIRINDDETYGGDGNYPQLTDCIPIPAVAAALTAAQLRAPVGDTQ